jgi:hypothetical protein
MPGGHPDGFDILFIFAIQNHSSCAVKVIIAFLYQTVRPIHIIPTAVDNLTV